MCSDVMHFVAQHMSGFSSNFDAVVAAPDCRQPAVNPDVIYMLQVMLDLGIILHIWMTGRESALVHECRLYGGGPATWHGMVANPQLAL